MENQEIIMGSSSDIEAVETPLAVAQVSPKEPSSLVAFGSVDGFETIQRMAKLLASSEIVPDAYKGKIANCVVAIDIANRMGLSPVSVMQNSQIVKGNFTWKGTACKAMVDSCGRYRSTRYVEVGEYGRDSWGFYLEAIDKDGNIVKGVTVTVKMAKAEGWYGRNPKWESMTELMLKYRAAAFFMRTECAALAMGYLTAEEVEDVNGVYTRVDDVNNDVQRALIEE